MSQTPHPAPTALPDDRVHWFGASRRLVGGQPDSRYGWLDWPDGPCIVKAMDPDLAAYNQTLLDHEKKVLIRLHALGAPVPALVDLGRRDWLATRFAGLSVQRLEQPFASTGTDPRVVFPLHERLAVWVHLLRRLQPLAERGVWVIDLYEANVVVPLTEGVHGQLRLREPMLIDHAHTLEAGMNLQRPVWLNRQMARIPPELQQALQQDQEALMAHFGRHGAALPGDRRLNGERDAHSRRLWAEYSAPQALQRLLDANQLDAGRAMQYAAAKAMLPLLIRFPDMPCRTGLQAVLARMTAQQPAARYATLDDAAAALVELMSPLPLVSRHRYGPLEPCDLQTPEQAAASVLTRGGTARAAPGTEPGTLMAGGFSKLPQRTDAEAHGPTRLKGVPAAWLWWVGGLGTVAGLLAPLPW